MRGPCPHALVGAAPTGRDGGPAGACGEQRARNGERRTDRRRAAVGLRAAPRSGPRTQDRGVGRAGGLGWQAFRRSGSVR
ncbi:hypothetical protein DEH18_00540 [Streptomyces sp. NHF165]|nr:hypothetical protein DEH18_00540 [Streptomyces sp. NHF165]